MATIASATVALNTNTASMSQGFKQVGGDVSALGNEAKNASDKMQEGWIKNTLGIIKMNTAISAGIEGFSLAKGAIMEVVHSIAEWVSQAIEGATAAFRLATSLHAPTDELMGLAQVARNTAGVSIDDFSAILNKMTKNIGEAAIAGGPMAAALQRIGLNAADLANMPATDAFKLIASRLGEVHNAAELSADSVAIFGREGQKIAPMIAAGSDAMEKGIADAKEMGTALSDIDAAHLVVAHEEMEKLEERTDGAKNALAIGLTPAITMVTELIASQGITFNDIKDDIQSYVRYFVEGIGTVADSWHWVKVGVEWVVDALLELNAKGGEAIESAAQKVIDFANMLPGVHLKLSDSLKEAVTEARDMANGYHQVLQDTLNEPLNSDAIMAAYNKAVASTGNLAQAAVDAKNKIVNVNDAIDENATKVQESIAKLKEAYASAANEGKMDAMIDSMKQMGYSPDQIAKAKEFYEVQKDIEALKAMPGVKQADIDAATAVATQTEEMKSRNEELKEGAKLMDEMRTPADKYADTIAHLNQLLKDGAIDQKTFAAAKLKAEEEANKVKQDKTKQTIKADEIRFNLAPVNTNKDSKVDKQIQIAENTYKSTKTIEVYARDLRTYVQNLGGEDTDDATTYYPAIV